MKIDTSKLFDRIRRSPVLSESTKNMYLSRLEDISRLLYSNKVKFAQILESPNDFLKRLTEYCNTTQGRKGGMLGDSCREIYVASILAIFKHNQDFREQNMQLYESWKDVSNAIRSNRDQKYDSNAPSEEEKKAYIPFAELCRIRDSLPDEDIGKLFLGMSTYIPPQRSDHCRTRIFKKRAPADFNDNYIVFGTDVYLILQNFKTAKKYKQIRIEFPPELVNILKASLKSKPRRYLFLSKSGSPFNNERSYNMFANRLLRKITKNQHISLNTLRHIYISNPELRLETKSGIERGVLAKQMGHSTSMQSNYLWHCWEGR